MNIPNYKELKKIGVSIEAKDKLTSKLFLSIHEFNKSVESEDAEHSLNLAFSVVASQQELMESQQKVIDDCMSTIEKMSYKLIDNGIL